MKPFKLAVVVLSFFALALTSGCREDPQQTGTTKDIDLSYLFRSWIRSYEEEPRTQTGSVNIFRPIEFKQFPPSQFRMRYIFSEDGKCEWLFLHPTDAHFMKQGTWRTDPQDSRVILIYDANRKLVESVSFRIIEIGEDLLRVKVGLISR